MEFNSQDQDIIDLLTKLKNADGAYPEHMLIARRRSFLKQMTEVGLGASAARGIRNAAARTKPPNTPPIASKLLETALIVAIVVEMSAMAYFYRDKLAEFFQDLTAASGVQEVTSPSAIPTFPETQGVAPSPAADSTSSSGTPFIPVAGPEGVTITPTRTPVPDDTQAANQLNSTPDPNGNNGNHYGQTPKPERTKENNGDGGNNGNNDKDPKPTKDK